MKRSAGLGTREEASRIAASVRDARLPGLDGLRAVAVVAVILFHLNLPGVLPAGFLGVDVFFTLSGFIITALLLREHARNGRVDWLAFCGRRARRLLPPTLAMIALAVPLTALFAPEAMQRLRADLPAALLYVSNWWQIHSQQSYFEALGRPPVLRHLWSLAIEEQFYLLWPLVVGVVLHWRGRAALAVTCALAALASTNWMAWLHQGLAEGGDPSRVYLGSDTHVMGLFVGAALACVLDPWRASGRTAAACVAVPVDAAVRIDPTSNAFARAALQQGLGFAALLASLLAMQQLHEASTALFEGGFLVLALATSVLIAASLNEDTWLARGLRLPPVQWLGTRSFSLYLWHWPVVVWLWPEPGATATATALNALLRLVLAGVAAELSYRLVEKGALWRHIARAGSTPSLGARPLVLRGALAASVSACALVLAYGLVPDDAVASASPASAGTTTAPVAAANEGIAAAMPLPAAVPAPVPVSLPALAPSSSSTSNPGVTPRPSVAPAIAQSQYTAVTASPATTAAPAMAAAALPSIATPAAPSAAALAAPAGCVHIVGDSVVLGAQPLLQRTIARAVVDAEVGRQGHQAQQILRQRMSAQTLCPNVVLHTGTNGYLHEARYLELVAALAARGRVVLVNIHADRRWTAPNNALIARAAREVPGVRLADWSAASETQRRYFVADGIHLTVAGMTAFAEQIRLALAGSEAVAERAAERSAEQSSE